MYNLPEEIILCILNKLEKEDIINFAHTNKENYNLVNFNKLLFDVKSTIINKSKNRKIIGKIKLIIYDKKIDYEYLYDIIKYVYKIIIDCNINEDIIKYIKKFSEICENPSIRINCYELFDIDFLHNFTCITLYHSENLKIDVSKFNKIKKLNLKSTNIDNLSNIPKLEKLNLSKTKIDDVKNLDVKKLVLNNCDNINDSSNIEFVKNLKTLDISLCRNITNINFLNLENIICSCCENIENIDLLEKSEKLNYLDLHFCTKITKIPNLNCKILDLSSTNIIKLPILKEIIELDLSSCHKLRDINNLKFSKNLKILSLNNLDLNNFDINILNNCHSLIELNILNCYSNNMYFIKNLKKLKYINHKMILNY